MFSAFNEVVRGSFTRKVEFETRPKGDEGGCQTTIWGKNAPSTEGTESARALCSHGLQSKDTKVIRVE